ncbi:putative nuclease HARBI1 [Saccostrea cucullata]|uniref:putative nuclease HARBI1 n=1 Tax=Saccostrea cuccullata TaxID=36930 RepID=UPI002ED06283
MALLQAILEENKIRRNRIFRDRLNPLDAYDDAEILSRYRMTRQCLMDVIDIVRKDVSHETKRSHALTPEEQTFAALRYYATGSFQQVVGDILGLSQPSVSRAVKNVSNALASFAGQVIQFPTDCRKLQTVKEGFMEKFGFPNVIGCVDGSFIPIKAPSSREDVYVCRKGFHAVNVQGICDSQKKFTNLLVKFPGSAHDAFIWSGAITVELTTAVKAIISTGVLHNICESKGIPLPEVYQVGAEDEGSEDITPTDRGQDVVEGEAVRASLIRAHFV